MGRGVQGGKRETAAMTRCTPRAAGWHLSACWEAQGPPRMPQAAMNAERHLHNGARPMARIPHRHLHTLPKCEMSATLEAPMELQQR